MATNFSATWLNDGVVVAALMILAKDRDMRSLKEKYN